MSNVDGYATAIAAWEDDGGSRSASAHGRKPWPTWSLRRDAPPPTTYLPTLDRCSTLGLHRREPRDD